MKNIIKLAMIFLFLHSFSAAANCTVLDSLGSITFDVGHVDVPYNAPVGTVLKTVTSTPTAGEADGCSLTTYDAYSRYTKGKATGLKYLNGNEIYSTNVAGIGFVICFRWCTSENTGWFPFVANNKQVAGDHLDFVYTWSYSLVLTGPSDSGTLDSGQYAELGVGAMAIVKAYMSGGTVKSVDCILDSSSIQIPFGDVTIDNFHSVGSSSQSKEFNIGLACDSKANISVTLDGEKSSETSDQSVLALTNAGTEATASGVGVQILYTGTPLKIGEKIALKTTDGHVSEILPFTARYYKTKDLIKPGNADATATLNITYQ